MEDKGPLETLPLQSITETSCHHIVSSVVVVAVVVLGIGRTETLHICHIGSRDHGKRLSTLKLCAPWLAPLLDGDSRYPSRAERPPCVAKNDKRFLASNLMRRCPVGSLAHLQACLPAFETIVG
jgi:hypothetical protein